MTLKAARELQREIKGYSYHCTVPLGRGPDGYVARIFSSDGNGGMLPIDFADRASFRAHAAKRLRERREINRKYAEAQAHQARRRDTRSPLDRMIDEACGLG